MFILFFGETKMMPITYLTTTSVFKPFQSILNKTNTDSSKNKKNNYPVMLTSLVGTAIPVLLIRKYQNKTLNIENLQKLDLKNKIQTILESFNIHYGLKEILLSSFSAIGLGLAGGLICNKDENKKNKLKEAIFQFNNIAIPTTLITGLLKITNKYERLNGTFAKLASIFLGIAAGMPIALTFTNTLNKSLIDKNSREQRKLKLKDSIVHVDDIISGLVLAKVPLVTKLHLEQFIPILYANCGYEAGIKRD